MPQVKTLKLNISKAGRVTVIYDDCHAGLLAQGDVTITRASHVEPDASGQWFADMSPSGQSVKLGPFKLRQQALDAEVRFLEALLFT